MRKLGLSILLCLALVVSVGCPRKVHITNLPVGVSQSQVNAWYTATGTMKTIADTNKRLVETLVALNRQGVFPDSPEYGDVMRALGNVSKAGLKADAILQSAPQHFTSSQKQAVFEATQVILKELQTTQGLLVIHVKNPASQQVVSAFIQTLLLSVQTAQQLSQ